MPQISDRLCNQAAILLAYPGGGDKFGSLWCLEGLQVVIGFELRLQVRHLLVLRQRLHHTPHTAPHTTSAQAGDVGPPVLISSLEFTGLLRKGSVCAHLLLGDFLHLG